MSDGLDRPSKKQRDLLSFIDGFIKGHGYGPSYREIMRALNYKSVSTVAIHVENLIKKGKLAKRDRSARSLVVLDDVSARPASVPVDAKWLVEQVNARLDDYQQKPSPQKYEQLLVLINALEILELDKAAAAAKSRLSDKPLA